MLRSVPGSCRVLRTGFDCSVIMMTQGHLSCSPVWGYLLSVAI